MQNTNKNEQLRQQESNSNGHSNLTRNILIAMLAGVVIGWLLHQLPDNNILRQSLVNEIFDLGGQIFITILKMVVVPVVFISLLCGTVSLHSGVRFGRMAGKTIVLYLVTTALAISIALLLANLFGIGADQTQLASQALNIPPSPPLRQTILNIFPSNPVQALAQGNMLQIIVFALLLGLAISKAGEAGKRIASWVKDIDKVIEQLIVFVIKLAPIGVFCLVGKIFAQLGIGLINQLAGYFACVLLVLYIQLLVIYPSLLAFIGKLSPIPFLIKMFPAQLFAFSTSSSNASIPVVLNTVENKLGVKEPVAAFVVPLGATINMDGTAIMQGVATVFIANSYGIHLGWLGFLKVVLTATLASIGTAGVPGVGMITLSMVLLQAGLPVEGIAMIIGVDRLLDMTRTAVNITGDATIACIVANSEKQLDSEIYSKRS